MGLANQDLKIYVMHWATQQLVLKSKMYMIELLNTYNVHLKYYQTLEEIYICLNKIYPTCLLRQTQNPRLFGSFIAVFAFASIIMWDRSC